MKGSFARVSASLAAFLAVLAGSWVTGPLPTRGAQPVLRTLFKTKWSPSRTPPSVINAVAGMSNHIYVALGGDGLAIVDVSNPTNYVQFGGYDTTDIANGVAV